VQTNLIATSNDSMRPGMRTSPRSVERAPIEASGDWTRRGARTTQTSGMLQRTSDQIGVPRGTRVSRRVQLHAQPKTARFGSRVLQSRADCCRGWQRIGISPDARMVPERSRATLIPRRNPAATSFGQGSTRGGGFEDDHHGLSETNARRRPERRAMAWTDPNSPIPVMSTREVARPCVRGALRGSPHPKVVSEP
jgi:hypothetical protein